MNVALILSGGKGRRMGMHVPKQYVEAGGRPIFTYCIESFSRNSQIDAISIVADLEWHNLIRKWLNVYDRKEKFRGFSCPGANRQLSIYNGLCDIRNYATDKDCVMIHDAVRPLISEEMIRACFQALEGHDGVMPGLPMIDTVYSSVDGSKITTLLNRGEIYAGQEPEVFNLGLYYKANQNLLPEQILRINGSTEPAIMAGMDIALIPGDVNNFKITAKSDLEKFMLLLESRKEIDGEIYDESLGASWSERYKI